MQGVFYSLPNHKEISLTEIPVFCNTGCTKENIAEKLAQSDGACVGTAFKKDGKFENFVEKERVQEFMQAVKEYRNTL